MLSVIIPTLDRHDSLIRVLKAISLQTYIPDEVIVVDASSIKKDLGLEFPFKFAHIQSRIKSTSYQRNLGLESISEDTKFVTFLDDDTIPSPDYFQNLYEALLESKSIGISAIPENILSEPLKKYYLKELIHRIFLLSSKIGGKILKSGVNVPFEYTNFRQIESAEWLIACAFWDFQAIKTVKFRTTIPGYSLGEDVLFSVECSNFGKLAVLRSERLRHEQASIGNLRSGEYWEKWCMYRKLLLINQHASKCRWFAFFWSNFGQSLIIIATSFTQKRWRGKELRGLLIGTFRPTRFWSNND